MEKKDVAEGNELKANADIIINNKALGGGLMRQQYTVI